MNFRQRVEAAIERDGVQTITHKLVIQGEHQHDIYVKTGWWRGRPVWVDLTISAGKDGENGKDKIPRSLAPLVVDLRRRVIESSRCLSEIVCREATLLLSSRRCSLDELADLWRATEGEPRGRCEQVTDELGDRVHGPFDAAAKLFKLKGKEWEQKMAHVYEDEEVEKMISDCQEAIEETPDSFTGFEREFIRSVAAQNETDHLSEKQIEKLEQIWEERVR
ncbi:MAG: hypothetical protein ABFD77_01170 [Thermotogota bacterium]